MQQDFQNDVSKDSMNGSSAVMSEKSIQATELAHEKTSTLGVKLSDKMTSLGVDFEQWSKVLIERYDVAAGVTLSLGKRAFGLARRHPFYTAAGVVAMGYLIGKSLKSSPSVSGKRRK